MANNISLFPIETKPMAAWAVSFLTIGFCKICYSLISGLSAIAMVYAGPKNTDMTVAAVALGLMAPALAWINMPVTESLCRPVSEEVKFVKRLPILILENMLH
jgi:hypothetical protein